MKQRKVYDREFKGEQYVFISLNARDRFLSSWIFNAFWI